MAAETIKRCPHPSKRAGGAVQTNRVRARARAKPLRPSPAHPRSCTHPPCSNPKTHPSLAPSHCSLPPIARALSLLAPSHCPLPPIARSLPLAPGSSRSMITVASSTLPYCRHTRARAPTRHRRIGTPARTPPPHHHATALLFGQARPPNDRPASRRGAARAARRAAGTAAGGRAATVGASLKRSARRMPCPPGSDTNTLSRLRH